MTEQEAKDIGESLAGLSVSCQCRRGQPCSCHNRVVSTRISDAILDAYARGVKAGEAKGGYRAGFEAGQASASKTIAELQAHVAALKATVDQCRAAGFIDDAGNVRKVLGTLPLTADGCVATINGTYYTPPDGDPDGICGMAAWAEGNAPVGRRLGFRVSYLGADRTWNSNECYSTREMAESARKAAEVKP